MIGHLSMMQEMAVRDSNGNCRCPYCGKYRRHSDFEKQPGHAPIGCGDRIFGHVHVAPACKFCLNELSMKREKS